MLFLDSGVMTLFLTISGSLASPTSEPSKVQRDDKPEPSQYPLDKPCENEWGYLNFDPDKDVDRQHLRRLHTAICDDITRILPHALDSSNNINIIFARYFGMQGEDFEGAVTSVYNRVFDFGKLTPLVGGFIIDNKGIWAPMCLYDRALRAIFGFSLTVMVTWSDRFQPGQGRGCLLMLQPPKLRLHRQR